jgi:hypothetical protein
MANTNRQTNEDVVYGFCKKMTRLLFSKKNMKMIITIVRHKVYNYLCEHSFLQTENKKHFIDRNALNSLKSLTKIKMQSEELKSKCSSENNNIALWVLLSIFPAMEKFYTIRPEDSSHLKRLGSFGIATQKAKFFICGNTHIYAFNIVIYDCNKAQCIQEDKR